MTPSSVAQAVPRHARIVLSVVIALAVIIATAAPDFRFDWQPIVGSFRVEARADDLRDRRMFEVVE